MIQVVSLLHNVMSEVDVTWISHTLKRLSMITALGRLSLVSHVISSRVHRTRQCSVWLVLVLDKRRDSPISKDDDRRMLTKHCCCTDLYQAYVSGR